ncbi:cytochrome P450 hydroxylase [Acrocarpospora corrugata]|uniref:Cytochrome P450 hydroxylase n=1 Tax=Acrocarpospora corrugata TaxID=35763 RepID=A0A5M3VSH8_9ACTN|nr:cytochrome P450 [Acrocarpospora corrugata]GER99473.1 cytochrome P450 hydroxylase [Acrocarpospora corrugata]
MSNRRGLSVCPPEELVAARHRDPYPYFAWLRAHAPAYREVSPSGLPVWQITRYDDVRDLLADPRLSKRPATTGRACPTGPAGLQDNLVNADPPEHTRLRKLVNKAFVPAQVKALEPLIQATAEDLLDRMPPGTADLIDDFAAPLAFSMIRTILGVPDDLDTPELRGMLLDTLTYDAAGSDGKADLDRRLHAYLAELIARKRREGGHGSGDLLMHLIAACDEAGNLTERELIGTAYILLLVGQDTTVNLIGNGTLALLRHRDQLDLLRERPYLIDSAIEELLRYDAPVRKATFRAAAEPLPLHGTTIPAGDVVSLVIASANRDPDRFERADELDLTRTPNDHLSLGRGPHFCVGAALARLEGRIAFPLLLRRLGHIELAVPPESLTWRPSRVMRGLTHLPISWTSPAVRRGRPC